MNMMSGLALVLIVLGGIAHAHSLSEGGYGPDSNWYLKAKGLYQLNGKLERGSEGLLVVTFLKPADESSIWPQYLDGTVCDDSFDDHAANLTCQGLGHKYAISWGSGPDNFRYVPEEFLENANVKILINDVRCGADATDIKECQASIMEGHDCSFSQSLWRKEGLGGFPCRADLVR